jgi:hypothetical protein
MTVSDTTGRIGRDVADVVATEAAGRGSDADDNTTGGTKDATRTSNKLQPTLPRRRLT